MCVYCFEQYGQDPQPPQRLLCGLQLEKDKQQAGLRCVEINHIMRKKKIITL